MLILEHASTGSKSAKEELDLIKQGVTSEVGNQHAFCNANTYTVCVAISDPDVQERSLVKRIRTEDRASKRRMDGAAAGSKERLKKRAKGPNPLSQKKV